MQHTQLVTPGYAAPEQYATKAKFGAYTDIYGVAATLYHALMGQAPSSSSDRVLTGQEITLPVTISVNLRNSIIAGLAIRIETRPQTAQEFNLRLEAVNHTQLGRVRPAQKPNLVRLKSISVAVEFTLIEGNPLVTNKRVEISHSRGRESAVSTYLLTDISRLWLTNDGWETIKTENKSSPDGFFWLAGILLLFPGIAVLSLAGIEFFLVIVSFSLISIVFGIIERSGLNQRHTYHLLAEFIPQNALGITQKSMRLLLFSSPYENEAQDLMNQINSYKNS